MRERTFLNIAFVVAFTASITGLIMALTVGTNELITLFVITTIMVAAAAVSTWIEK